MKKRLLSLALTLAVAVTSTVVPVSVFAEETTTDEAAAEETSTEEGTTKLQKSQFTAGF